MVWVRSCSCSCSCSLGWLLRLLLLLLMRSGFAVRRQQTNQLSLWERKAQGAKSDAEFVVIEMAIAIEVEQCELPSQSLSSLSISTSIL